MTSRFQSFLKRLNGKHNEDEYIFILSAMRSGSTLLQHLVGQQEDVLSAGETKIEYHRESDLDQLKRYLKEYNSIEEEEDQKRYRYLEKCVHNRYFEEPFAINGNTLRYLFIIRDPVPAMTSLLELEGWPYAESRESAAWYYDNRFKALTEFAKKIPDPQNALFLSYEGLLENPESETERISQFLRCDPPLATDYPKQRWTAKLSLGDVSDNIKTSKIVPNKRKKLVALEPDTREELEALYSQTKDQLRDLCKA
jgi:hypothetical protein